MIADIAEEFNRRQVPRDIGHAVRINANHVVVFGGLMQRQPSILNNHVEIWLIHVKEFPARIHNIRIDLDAINLNARAERRGVLVRNRASRQPNNTQTFDILRTVGRCIEKRRDHKHIPRSAKICLVGIVDRVVALTLVQQKHPRICREWALRLFQLHDLNIVISGIFLVEQRFVWSGGAQWTVQRQQRQYQQHDGHPDKLPHSAASV